MSELRDLLVVASHARWFDGDLRNPHNNGSHLRGLIHDASRAMKRLEEIERLTRVMLAPFSGHYECSACLENHGGHPSFMVVPEECDCGCHETARHILALREALDRELVT